MPKPVTAISFTKTAIVAIKPPTDQERVYVYDKRTPALALCVTQGGGRTFYVYRRIHRRPVRVRLGRFPSLDDDRPSTKASRFLTLLCKLFNYGRRTLRSDKTNACEGVRRYHETTRERFLNEKELKRLIRALASEPEPFRSFFLLSPVTQAGRLQLRRCLGWLPSGDRLSHHMHHRAACVARRGIPRLRKSERHDLRYRRRSRCGLGYGCCRRNDRLTLQRQLNLCWSRPIPFPNSIVDEPRHHDISSSHASIQDRIGGWQVITIWHSPLLRAG